MAGSDNVEKPERPALKKRVTAEARREELIDAAIAVIGRKGLSGTTLADVAAYAGISYGNVTFRFKTKSALLLAALEKVTSEYVDHREAAAGDDNLPAAERLDAVIAASFDRKVASKRKIAVWHAFLSECHIHASYQKLFSRLQEREYSLTRQLCEALIESEGREDLDVHLLTVGVSSLVEGLWFNLRLAPNAVNREEARRVAHTFLASLFPMSFGPILASASADDDARGQRAQ